MHNEDTRQNRRVLLRQGYTADQIERGETVPPVSREVVWDGRAK
jgi:hypothetical protein